VSGRVKRALMGALPDPIVRALREVKRGVLLQAERHGRLQRRINRRIVVDGLPRRRRRAGSVWAVCLAKNEEDIIVHSTRHMLDQGVDGVIVVDNGSTDRTGSLLAGLAAEDARVHAGVDAEPGFFQGMKTSYLAHLAWRAGADWVVPFDADEFWFARGASLAEHLARQPADRVWCDYRTVYPLVADGRIDLDAGRPVQVDRRPTAWRKIAFRARRWAWVGEGNHDLRDRGPRPAVELHMLHYSCRSLEQCSRKASQGVAALDEAGKDETIATHWRGWAALDDEARAAEWVAYLRGEAVRSADGAAAVAGSESLSADRVEVADPMSWRTWDPGHVLDGDR
jgi:hypothetical protein